VTRVTKHQIAGGVWEDLLGYFFAHREHTMGIAAELGMTPGHVKTLFALDPTEVRSMGEIAELLMCDASNATWLIDRLEERDLVERRPHPRDRRVKTVVLTRAGADLKTRLIERMSAPPQDLLALDRAELETLAAALRLLPEHPPFWEVESATPRCHPTDTSTESPSAARAG
jgi:DNA-binding MarR family transcriptional regulator